MEAAKEAERARQEEEKLRREQQELQRRHQQELAYEEAERAKRGVPSPRSPSGIITSQQSQSHGHRSVHRSTHEHQNENSTSNGGVAGMDSTRQLQEEEEGEEQLWVVSSSATESNSSPSGKRAVVDVPPLQLDLRNRSAEGELLLEVPSGHKQQQYLSERQFDSIAENAETSESELIVSSPSRV